MVTANFAGSIEPGQGAVIVSASKTAAAIVKGNVLTLSSNKWVKATTSASGPFAVALEAALAATPTIKIALRGIVYVIADGVINPNDSLVVSASTAGEVQATATPFAGGVVGMYLGKENESGGAGGEATAAADGDTIRIRLGAM